MKNRLKFLTSFLSELDSEGIWHVVLRNHEDILAGTEKDVDLLCSASDFHLTRTVFSKVCSKNGRVASWNVSGKSLFLSTGPDAFDAESNSFPRGLIIHFVAFVSVRDSYFKLKIPGYSLRFRNAQIQRERLVRGSFKCWVPSSDWLIFFLLEKIQYKRKVEYKNEILRLLNTSSSKIGANKSLLSVIDKSLDERSTRSERLLAVKKVLGEIDYKSNCLKGVREWLRLILENICDALKKKGLIIIFSGPDGAGKTTTKTQLINFLQNDIGLSVYSIKGFNRLNEPKFMGSAITKVQHCVRGVSEKSASDLEYSHRDRKPEKGGGFFWKFRRFIGLLFILIQYPIFYFAARIRTYFGVTTVVDTSVFDRFVKAHRPRFRVLEKVFTPLLPSGDMTFRLYAPPEVIAERKPELTIKELEEYYSVMDDIFSLKHSSRIETIETHLGSTIAAKRVNQYVMYELGLSKSEIRVKDIK